MSLHAYFFFRGPTRLFSILKNITAIIRKEGALLLTALLTPLVLKNQVLDAYVVSTPSMEPTIEGDPNKGDRVFVDKLWDNLSNPSRYNLVVFRLREKTVVKRIVGLPEEWFKIEDYDLWVGKEAGSLKRLKKSPTKDKDMLAVYWDSQSWKAKYWALRWNLNNNVTLDGDRLHLDGRQTKEGALFLEATKISPKSTLPGNKAWHMRFKGNITTGYIDGFGKLKEPYNGKNSVAKDFGFQAQLKLSGKVRLWVLYRYLETPFILILGDGKVRVWRESMLLHQSKVIPKLKNQDFIKITLVFLDGRFCLSINNQDVWDFEPSPSQAKRLSLGLLPGNDLMLAATGGEVTVRSLKIIHDFHYLELGRFGAWNPIRLQKREFFVLGDNSQDSQDSRHFGPIRKEAILGRPLMVAAPSQRFHFFPR